MMISEFEHCLFKLQKGLFQHSVVEKKFEVVCNFVSIHLKELAFQDSKSCFHVEFSCASPDQDLDAFSLAYELFLLLNHSNQL